MVAKLKRILCALWPDPKPALLARPHDDCPSPLQQKDRAVKQFAIARQRNLDLFSTVRNDNQATAVKIGDRDRHMLDQAIMIEFVKPIVKVSIQLATKDIFDTCWHQRLICLRISSLLSSDVLPAAAMRPFSRMAKRCAAVRANRIFCSTRMMVRP